MYHNFLERLQITIETVRQSRVLLELRFDIYRMTGLSGLCRSPRTQIVCQGTQRRSELVSGRAWDMTVGRQAA